MRVVSPYSRLTTRWDIYIGCRIISSLGALLEEIDSSSLVVTNMDDGILPPFEKLNDLAGNERTLTIASRGRYQPDPGVSMYV